MTRKPLQIGTLVAPVPIIQGGMGVGVSLSSLAGAVAKEGGIGVISAAHPGYLEPDFQTNTIEANVRALGNHIKRAKELSGGGIIGVNIMRAMRNYDLFVACCVESGADIIISGAGLPLELPQLLGDAPTKYAPIVSSLKATKVLFTRWQKRNLRLPDLVVIEGPKAGGHLGFSPEDLEEGMASDYVDFDEEVKAIIAYVQEIAKTIHRPIPVVFGGGVYDKADMDHYLNLGCDGVQMATRFVATEECDADMAFKQAYVNASKETISIVKSPVGLPGRAIDNPFMEARKTERENISRCVRCLEKCDPKTTPYCITGALIRAVQGDTENSLLFCGSNASRVEGITTVKAIIDELMSED